MEYEKFKEQFVEDLKAKLEEGGEKYQVETNEVQKMNETYEAVTVKPERTNNTENNKTDLKNLKVKSGEVFDVVKI